MRFKLPYRRKAELWGAPLPGFPIHIPHFGRVNDSGFTAEGFSQTWAYMDRSGTMDGHLIIFDRGESRTWDEKIFKRSEIHQNVAISVWGM